MNINSLDELNERFQSEEACIEYFFHAKWPQGFVCPSCGFNQCYLIPSRTLYECKSCQHQTSLKAGTVMEGSRTTLRKWMTALFLASHPTPSINAVQLSKQINVTYKTAWLMLHKIRYAMNQVDSGVRLCGFVEINDACYGKPYKNKYGRHPKEHPVLIAASSNTVQGVVSHVKMKAVPERHLSGYRVNKMGMEAFIKQNMDPQIKVAQMTFQLGQYKPRRYKKLFSFFSEANQWIKETFHGLGIRHLNAYLSEFCFRLNRIVQQDHILESLVQSCMKVKTITYKALVC